MNLAPAETRRSTLAVWPDGYDDKILDLVIMLDTTNNASKFQYRSLTDELGAQAKKLLESYPSINISLVITGEAKSGIQEIGNYAVRLPLGKHIDYVNGVLRYDGLADEVGKLKFFKHTSGENGRFEDNILHSLKGVIETTEWRANSRKAIIYFSDGGLKEVEDDGLDIAGVAAVAEQEGVDILPVFNSTNSYGDQQLQELQNVAREQHRKLATSNNTYLTEFDDYAKRPHELRDVLINYYRQPIAKISLAGGYGATDEVTYDTPRFVIGEEVRLSATECYDPDSVIESIEWDIDNDGLVDYIGPTINHTYHNDFNSTINITIRSADGGVLEHEQNIIVGGRTSESIVDLPLPTTPNLSITFDEEGIAVIVPIELDDHAQIALVESGGSLVSVFDPSIGNGVYIDTEMILDKSSVSIYTLGPNGKSNGAEIDLTHSETVGVENESIGTTGQEATSPKDESNSEGNKEVQTKDQNVFKLSNMNNVNISSPSESPKEGTEALAETGITKSGLIILGTGLFVGAIMIAVGLKWSRLDA